jgi:hypothetical protein
MGNQAREQALKYYTGNHSMLVEGTEDFREEKSKKQKIRSRTHLPHKGSFCQKPVIGS